MIFRLVFGAMIGGALGSFVSATTWAWLHHEPCRRRRSICGHCGRELAAWQLVPVLSWLFLRGKCAYCSHAIPVFHFLVELASMVLCALVAGIYGLNWLALCYMILAAALVAASAADIVRGLLPDYVTIGCVALVPPIVLLNPQLTAAESFVGYVAGGGVPLLLGMAFRQLRRKDGLGYGDIKLFALGGALTGWQALPFMWFCSALAGIAAFVLLAFLKEYDWKRELPFGPFIAGIIMLILLCPWLPPACYQLLWMI